MRLSLLGGRWRYTERGILDRTHAHLFTRKTLTETVERPATASSSSTTRRLCRSSARRAVERAAHAIARAAAVAPRLPVRPRCDAAVISVVIPVKNGGADLARCLAGIAAQEVEEEVEIVVVDSGSTDGSPERARAAGAVVHEIPPEEFGHGRTRNLGVELARGDTVVFTSQDAVADDSGWLARLVAAARSGPNVAGAYGRQLPHPDARPPERFFLDFMYGPEPRVSSGSIRTPSSPSRRRSSRTSTPRSRARSSSATRSATT